MLNNFDLGQCSSYILKSWFHVVAGPSWQDETGEEGVLLLPQDGIKKVRVGGKLSASKTRQSEHESTGQMKDAYERQKAITKVEAVDEAWHVLQPERLCQN